MENSKVFAMKFSKIYPLLIQKAEKKGRTKQEVDEVICWLTGYDADGLAAQLKADVNYQTFFEQAPSISILSSLSFFCLMVIVNCPIPSLLEKSSL